MLYLPFNRRYSISYLPLITVGTALVIFPLTEGTALVIFPLTEGTALVIFP